MTPSSTTPVSIGLRRATAQDSDFAYQVKKTTIGDYVRQVWGWDEDEQRRLHERRFSSQDFRIVVVSGIDAGVLALEYMPDCLRVNQLLLLPEYQGRGIGTACMRQVLDDAAGRGLPVRLQVLKANGRAAGFYRRLGFRDAGADDTHIKLERPVDGLQPTADDLGKTDVTATRRGPIRLNRVPGEPYPELSSVLRELVTSVQNVLDANLIGVYLVGSLATGDFDLDSDVDFLVVIEDDVADEVVQALQAMHERIHGLGCYPAEHLEGSYVSRAVLNRAESVGVQPLWYIDNGSTVLERSTHDNQWHVRWVLRERGIALLGPEAATLLAPVSVEAVRGEAHGVIRRIAQEFTDAVAGPLTFWTSRFGQSYAVLQLCRVLYTLETGTVRSKLSGVRWALEALDPAWAELIRTAWEEREGVRYCLKIRQQAAESALAQTHEFIKYAVRESETRFAR